MSNDDVSFLTTSMHVDVGWKVKVWGFDITFIFFISLNLFVYPSASDNNSMNDQLHQIYFSFIQTMPLCLCSLFFIFFHSPLQFVVHFIQWFKVNTYIHIDKRTTDPKVVLPLCSIHLTFETVVLVPVRIQSIMNMLVRCCFEEKRGEEEEKNVNQFERNQTHAIQNSAPIVEMRIRIIVLRSTNKISRSPTWNLVDNSMSN